MTETDHASAVALIGMSGRFPGAASPAQLWHNLLHGVKGLRELTDDELLAAGAEPGQLASPRYVRVGGPVAGLDRFDASVFGFTPREAETMSPQHRLFLECTWEALEGAGYCPTDAPGHVAVFAGCGFPDYLVQNQHLVTEPGGLLLMAVGNERDSLASLVSYKLGLRGPAIAVQTFCSTSLVAVHLACQSLLTYECDIALAGGAYLPLPQPAGYLYENGGITSPDGIVRSFDAEANGTVMGSGVGVVALKRMSEAVEDGDLIHAVILGSATNNDGRMRAGYTAPCVTGQAEVIETALNVAGVKPDTIGYVECHATGTVLGDSIELASINRAFAQSRDTPCVLGSLKPSVGHLDRASGVTGLIRATLNLKHELLPATPNYQTPNPALAGAQDRFTVLTEHRPWPAGPHPRRAGVSSFGLGGTNAHVVLEQAPPRPDRPRRPGPHLLVFSAVDDAALAELTGSLRQHLAEHRDEDIADVAFTLQVSRGGFALRRAVVCHDHDEAIAALGDPARWLDGRTQRSNPRVRLVTPDAGVPDAWWAELGTAVTALLSAGSAPTGPDTVVRALANGLSRLGVHILRDESAAPAEVEEIAVAPGDGESAAGWLLRTVARLWQAGSAIDWPALHRGAGRRVELPTYPFQRRRYWVDARPSVSEVPDVQRPAAPATTGKNYDRSRWTYLPTWQLRPRPVADLDERLRQAGPWLVFTADERGEALVERLTESGVAVTAVRPGDHFGRDEAGFTVRVDDPDDMARLLGSLAAGPRSIIHGFSLASPQRDPAQDPAAHFDTEQRRGFYSALALARAIASGTGGAPRAELILLTSGAVGVVGTDLRHPEHSTVAALGPSLAQENPRLRCRHIDTDVLPVDNPGAAALMVTQVLAASVAPHEGPVAVRANEVWLRRYEPFPIDEPGQDNLPVRSGDTVLITGGLGDVGLVLARHLARRGCRLVLVDRPELPPREQWAGYLEAVPAGGEHTAQRLRDILDLERQGAPVLVRSADVADLGQMGAVVGAAAGAFGRIDVVVHGAASHDGRLPAHLTDRSQCEAHFSTRVKGFLVLQKVLAEHNPDRRITLSSIAAVLGGMTLAPYAAASAALDAYARAARMSGAGQWITVDWDAWNVNPDRAEGAAVTDYAMTRTEGVDVWDRALSVADQTGHLVISTGSLDARIAQWVTGDLHATGDEDVERHPRPDLSTRFVAPREGTETALAEIWSAAFAIERVGAVDDFDELGGDSLIAIEITARIRETLGVTIPVTHLLERPTVRELAELIDPASAGHVA